MMPRRALRAFALLALVAGGEAARARPLPGRGIAVTARGQPIADFLRTIFGQAGISVVIAPGLEGAVNGRFTGSLPAVYRRIAPAFDLGGYFDGRTMYVAPGAATASKSFPLGRQAAARIVGTVRGLGMNDGFNRVQVAGGALFAQGDPHFIEQVAAIAEAPADPAPVRPPPPAPVPEFRLYRLRYAWADDVTLKVGDQEVQVPGVASLLRSVLGLQAEPAKTTQKEIGPQPARAALTPYGGGKDKAPDAPPPNTPRSESEGSSGITRVQADPRLNAVIIRDTRGNFASYEPLIAALHVAPQMVEIDATVIDVDVARMRRLGFNWQMLVPGLGPAFGTALLGAGAGGFAATALVNGDVGFVGGLRALETAKVAHVVAQPRILTLSDVQALYQSSQKFFVRVNGFQDSNLYDVAAGIELKVLPHVIERSGGNQIKLLVTIQDDHASSQSVDKIPVVDQSGLSTQAILAEGQSLLLGGMRKASDTRSSSKVPLLGDIPVIGDLFATRSREEEHLVRLFLISPRLVPIGKAEDMSPPCLADSGCRP